MTHTAEPWSYTTFSNGDLKGFPCGIYGYHEDDDPEDEPVFLVADFDDTDRGEGKDIALANVARICACVNACAGIADPSVVPELVEALRTAKETIYAWHGKVGWDIYDRSAPEMVAINAALAKVKGDSNE